MSPFAKHEYYQEVTKRYRKASRAEKSRILDEFCANCTIRDRNYAIHKLNHPEKFLKKHKKRPGRISKYDCPEVLKPLKTIWLQTGLICSKNLVSAIPRWLKDYDTTCEPLSDAARTKILSISPATIDRLFKKVRPQYKLHGLSTTKPGSLLREHIPIKTEQWDETRPGFLEADTVAHCGTTLLGTYVFTLDTVDIATCWTEQRAVFGKGEIGVCKQIADIENALPFDLLGFDSDQGSEFFNWHLERHFHNRKRPVEFTNSRAYKKNDNAHVEQKNWTHVRQWIGYDRFEHPELVPLLNDLYTQEWRLFHNFFIPSVKLIEKNRIGSKTIKVHDKPKTPFQRILESKHIPQPTKDVLIKQEESLNPFLLRRTIDSKLKRFFHTLKQLNKKGDRS